LVYKERCVDGEAQVQEHMHTMRETITKQPSTRWEEFMTNTKIAIYDHSHLP